MNTLDKIDRLAGIARGEQVPVDGVSGAVVQRIMAAAPRRRRILPLSFFAAVSGIAAAVVLGIGLHLSVRSVDPIWNMIAPVQDAPLW